MATDWQRDDSGLTIAAITAKQPYKLEGHVFGSAKRMPWAFCKRCGLINLRNDLTAWAVKVGCNASDHPEYASRVKHSRPRTT